MIAAPSLFMPPQDPPHRSPNAPRELHGMVAVVTGSSGGIGRAIAEELAAGGAAVVVHARRSIDAAEQVAAEIRRQGGHATVLAADLCDAQRQDALVEQAFAWQGRVDAWINNAGVDVLTGEAAAWPFERKLAALCEVDLTATMRLSRLAGLRMKQAGSGLILNMGWDQAERGMAGDSGEMFAAIKGAVMAFSKSLARSLAPHVRVNCLAPGWIKTAWGAEASDYWQQRATQESLLGRWGEPRDIALTARHLVSPAAAFINGQVVAVNGGLK